MTALSRWTCQQCGTTNDLSRAECRSCKTKRGYGTTGTRTSTVVTGTGLTIRSILRPTSAEVIAGLLDAAVIWAAGEKAEALRSWTREMDEAGVNPFEDCPETSLKKAYDLACEHELFVREMVEGYRRRYVEGAS